MRGRLKEHPLKAFPTIGCCGIDCGLCPRYYTEGSSRCPGCAGPDFHEKRPSCGYVTCCVGNRKLEVCAQCGEFPCSRFASWLDSTEAYDSFTTHRAMRPNLDFIRTHGMGRFIEQQTERIDLLRAMLDEFDDGRSRSFYCVAAALLPVAALEESLQGARQEARQAPVKPADKKTGAGILRALLGARAARAGVELKLRKKEQKK